MNFFDALLFPVFNGSWRSDFLDVVMPLFSDAWLLWLGLALFLGAYAVFCRQHYGEALPRLIVLVVFLGLSAGVADGLCNVIKDETGRYRPFQSVEGTHFFTPERTWTVVDNPTYTEGSIGGSFPSSHAATSMAVALGVALLFARSRPWIFALPLLVGWSRIYVGKHFPADVIVGWIVGAIAVILVWSVCLGFVRYLLSRRRKAASAHKLPQS